MQALLVQTNLHNHRKKSVASFSGNVRHRFGIAQALLGDPGLLIVDEPTGGLMGDRASRLFDYKAAKRNRMVAIRAVAHKMARAAYFIQRDRVAFDAARLFG